MRRYPLIAFAFAAWVAGCGSRTGLPVLSEGEPSAPQEMSSGNIAPDDGGQSPGDALVPADALPPIDVASPANDAPGDCPDAAATLVYVVSQNRALMSFYPPTATFRTIGRISCPGTTGFEPFSMAVDRTGIAYVLFVRTADYSAGKLFRVSTATASCRSTGFVSGELGFGATFGMAFVKDTVGTSETLYVAEGGDPNMTSFVPCPGKRLASIDTGTFSLSLVGALDPTVCSPELTGTGAGDLFGFYALSPSDSAIGQIDKAIGRLTGQSRLNGVAQKTSNYGAWAFGFWGGDFYTFTAPTSAGSVVTRFRPTDGSVVTVSQTAETIVGAGVSTCAPQQ